MSRRRMSFTENRRARLALKANPDRLERKHTITEPINVLALTTSALRGLAQIGIMQTDNIGRAMGAVARPTATVIDRPSPSLQALVAGASSVAITAPFAMLPPEAPARRQWKTPRRTPPRPYGASRTTPSQHSPARPRGQRRRSACRRPGCQRARSPAAALCRRAAVPADPRLV